ncbi:MAG: oxidoreductase [Terriglobia bacterium]|nr:oxidoreductase [Terriglobia bacterium]
MPDKPKIALYWCASCGGCDEAVVDLAEGVLTLTDAVDIAFWPVALDGKRSDVENLADGGLLATLINGAVRNSEQEEMAHLLRAKSQYIIAFGACAHLGGIPGLANLYSSQDILSAAFNDSPTTEPDAVLPRTNTLDEMHALGLPEFRETVKTLDQVIAVDYYIPGCPPSRKVVSEALRALVSGELPDRGTVLAPNIALCEECPRKESKPEKLSLESLHRTYGIEIDPEKCLLAQGIVCLGMGTRAGCDAACIRGNMPCTGCFGPSDRVRDQGAKLLSALASSLSATETEAIDLALAELPDEVGTFYRYSLPGSLLQRALVHSK